MAAMSTFPYASEVAGINENNNKSALVQRAKSNFGQIVVVSPDVRREALLDRLESSRGESKLSCLLMTGDLEKMTFGLVG